jgi:hypothetical protein
METKEQLAEEYAQEQNSAYTNDYYGFLAGFTAAEVKWISVEKQLPEDDKTVLVWVDNTQNPQWSSYGLGSYINRNWYLKGGREIHEIVTDWCQIPAKK